MKKFFGIVFFVIDLGAFILGVILTGIGLGLLGGGTGEGGIRIVVENVGELTGVNGHLVVLLAGVFVVAATLGYASKAVVEAIKYESGWKDAVEHFNPGL